MVERWGRASRMNYSSIQQEYKQGHFLSIISWIDGIFYRIF